MPVPKTTAPTVNELLPVVSRVIRRDLGPDNLNNRQEHLGIHNTRMGNLSKPHSEPVILSLAPELVALARVDRLEKITFYSRFVSGLATITFASLGLFYYKSLEIANLAIGPFAVSIGLSSWNSTLKKRLSGLAHDMIERIKAGLEGGLDIPQLGSNNPREADGSELPWYV